MRSAKNQVMLILRSLLSFNSRTSSSIKPSSSSSLELLYQKSDDHAKENELIMDKDDDDQPSSSSSSTLLTVWRKSLLLTCSGFTVIDPEGNLAYRVDNYTGRPRDVVLMDGNGKCILTICRRRKNFMADHWLIYEGDHVHNHNNRMMMMLNYVLQTSLIKRIISSKKHPRRHHHHHQQQQQQQILVQQPVYCVKKQRMKNYIFPSSSTSYTRRLLTRHNQQTSNKSVVVNKVLAHVYLMGGSESADSVDRDDHHPQKHDVGGDSSHKMKIKKKKKKKWPVYVVVGSYCKRNCTVWDYERKPKVVAEVKSKKAVKDGVSFGKEVFHLIVRPGFDPDFAMAFVLLLDQMFT